ncbi:hypothetical protein [Actinacidiphila alni]|uniref:Uncharacterized protein n=1 Tax=Actinacidiphila alni TaxID=380248 RepID=A0A1I1ZCA1_9ACTN|nr:hypothetical protein [Actinacidiphila alni]SFE29464.1 hypothetical protein SAMN05216251_102406 [Actinacidiphila alni]
MAGTTPRFAVALYSVSATSVALGALLWARDRNTKTHKVYSDYLAADTYSSSDWRIWTPNVPEDRLGLYLIVAGVLLALITRFVLTRRG